MPESVLSPNAVYSAIPTVRVNGAASDKVTAQLLAMDMREQEGGLSSLELRFSNFASFAGGLADQVFEDGALLKLGVQLDVYAGDVSAPTQIFSGPCTALEARFPRSGPPELIVLAEDPLQKARMARRTKTWDSTSLSDLVSSIASSLGLTPQLDGLDSTLGTEIQYNESDLHFLRRLLARYDADLQVVGTELHASPRASVQRTQVTLAMNSQLSELRVIADLADQVTATTVTGWDASAGSRINVTSSASALGPGAGNTGATWLNATLGQRNHHLAQLPPVDTAEAQALADADFVQRARGFVVAHGSCEGNPSVRVGTRLTLTGLGPRFSNDYYVTSTLHHFDTAAGYQTEFTAESAYLGGSL